MDIINTLTEKSLAKYFDHTFLKAYATRADFEKLCKEARELGTAMVAINSAQVCVCKELLKGCDVHVGAAISFPLGQTVLEIKVEETKKAIQDGADEIDYVINIGEAKMGHWDYIEEEMRQITEICRAHKVISKVIFENCYLTDQEKEALCRIALEVRPDFIKTSTGFGSGGATAADIMLMKRMVGDAVKIKAAGGIRTLDTALEMIGMGVSRIGSKASVSIVEELKARQRGS